MDNFETIYKILKILQKAMDFREFDKESISADALGLSIPKWNRLLAMLATNGYITGVYVVNTLGCDYLNVFLKQPEITLAGLEYLEENPLMQKASKIAKGSIETISNML